MSACSALFRKNVGGRGPQNRAPLKALPTFQRGEIVDFGGRRRGDLEMCRRPKEGRTGADSKTLEIGRVLALATVFCCFTGEATILKLLDLV